MNMRNIITLCEGVSRPPGQFWDWFRDSKFVDENGNPLIVYHQTSKEGAEGIARSGFDISKVGARGSDEQMPDGIFFKPTDAGIGRLGSGKNAVQLAYFLSASNPLRLDDRDALDAFLCRDAAYASLVAPIKDLEDRRMREYNEIEDRFDAHWPPKDGSQGPLPGYHEACDEMNSRYDAVKPVLAAKARAQATKTILGQGYDALIVTKDVGAFGRTLTTFVVFSSDQVRKVPDHRLDLDRKTRIAASWGRSLPPDDGNYD